MFTSFLAQTLRLCGAAGTLLLVVSFASQSHARQWSSKDGNYKVDAELISFNDELAVLKKTNGDLIAVELKDLSVEDQEFVRSEETEEALEKSAQEMQTWTGRDGMKVRGRVTAFGRKELVVQRRMSQVYINGTQFDAIDPLHQRLVLKILSHLEKVPIEDQRQLQQWARSLGGMPKTYMLEGVLMELESGDEIPVPFFLFDPKELEILKPGWELWLERDESEKEREKESFLVRSQAMAYQRDREVDRQIEMVKLSLLAAATGAVDIWQVGLTPSAGTYGRPMAVMVPAQNSQLAVEMAIRQYPGSQVIGVRRASR